MTRSSLVVLVPAAEATVAPLRARHDTMAQRGVPAHVTVLAFRPVVDEHALHAIASVAATIPPFNVVFAAVGRFPDGSVFLAPEPANTFKHIIRVLAEAFPDCDPHAGPFPDPTPHLTVGRHLDATTADEVAAVLATGLPITTVVDTLSLVSEDDDGFWTVTASWPLGR